MRIDFKADFLEYVNAELSAMGIQSLGNDLTASALLLFKLQRRCPSAQPRKTQFSTSFAITPDLESGLAALCLAVTRGDSLAPYLSRSTFNPARKDALLDDWGILHFHLGDEILPNGLVKGTEMVAFGVVRPDCVYFIDVHPHGSKYPTAWVRENLIWTIEANWPELLPSNSSALTPDHLTPKERSNLRKKSVNVTVSKASGDVMFPIGGGVMCDGTVIVNFMQLQRLYAMIECGQKLCILNESAVRDALGVEGGDFQIRLGFENKKIFFYEPATRTEIQFTQFA